jgi:hypothetical protein
LDYELDGWNEAEATCPVHKIGGIGSSSEDDVDCTCVFHFADYSSLLITELGVAEYVDRNPILEGEKQEVLGKV